MWVFKLRVKEDKMGAFLILSGNWFHKVGAMDLKHHLEYVAVLNRGALSKFLTEERTCRLRNYTANCSNCGLNM